MSQGGENTVILILKVKRLRFHVFLVWVPPEGDPETRIQVQVAECGRQPLGTLTGERGGEEGKGRKPVKKENAIEQVAMEGQWGLHTPQGHPTLVGGQPGDVSTTCLPSFEGCF